MLWCPGFCSVFQRTVTSALLDFVMGIIFPQLIRIRKSKSPLLAVLCVCSPSAVLALMLIASTLVLGLIAPYQHAPRGSAAAASQPPQSLSRRALGQRLLAGSALLVPRGAHALFESAAQSSLSSLANVQPKVKGVINEVTEFDRRRARMPADGEDDAYVHAKCKHKDVPRNSRSPKNRTAL